MTGEGGGVRQNTTVLCPIYYADDDMFRPLWAIFRSQKCVKKKTIEYGHSIDKGKAVPLQAWTGPEGSRKLRFPVFVTTAQDGGKVVSLTHRPPLPPRKYSWYSFMLEAESTPGP